MKQPPPVISCKQLADFLLDYTAGDLPARQRKEFDRHLAACPPCIAYLATYERTVSLEKSALCGRGDEIPPEVPEALLRAILAARKKAPRKK